MRRSKHKGAFEGVNNVQDEAENRKLLSKISIVISVAGIVKKITIVKLNGMNLSSTTVLFLFS